jgi:acyl-CoA reductase-like NAD-dependent aldehyde dehydrogenase
MPMLRTIKIAAIAVSMVNPVRSLGGKSAAVCTVKVIRRAAKVAAALMIFGNSGRQCVPAIDTREGTKRGDPDHITS